MSATEHGRTDDGPQQPTFADQRQKGEAAGVPIAIGRREEIGAEIRANADEAERWKIELTGRESGAVAG